MKKSHHWLLWMSLMFLTGCVSVKYNYTPSEIGHSAIQVNSRAVYDHLLGTYVIMPGVYLKRGESETHEFFSPAGGLNSGHIGKTGALDDHKDILAVNKETGVVGVVTVFNMRIDLKQVDYKRITFSESM